ncbi:hypothetical protein [Siphonobacter sp. BAB-5385]|uniref:hypothetical protein n=1 Tax=Siphonobacter sp. BAB-5385 TaxID=1864822 RepID=UPI0020CBA209|nr:hypothetical protein [Siphonobacter sp. BAB-5385]
MLNLIRRISIAGLVGCSTLSLAQTNSLVNTSQSKFSRLRSLDLDAVQWTTGFWADRFRVCRDSMVPQLWKTYTDADVSHAYRNFEVAAGVQPECSKDLLFTMVIFIRRSNRWRVCTP